MQLARLHNPNATSVSIDIISVDDVIPLLLHVVASGDGATSDGALLEFGLSAESLGL